MMGLRIVIDPKFQSDEDLVKLSRYLKQKYCKQKTIIAQVFDNKSDARDFAVFNVSIVPDTLRAIYYIDRDLSRERLVRIKVVDNRQIETPIKLPDEH